MTSDPFGVDPVAWLRELLAATGSSSNKTGTAWQCPAHPDGDPSLSVKRGTDRDVALVYCFAGCSLDDVLDALKISSGHLAGPLVTVKQHLALTGVRVDYATFAPKRSDRRSGGAGWHLESVHTYADGAAELHRWRHKVTGEKDLEWHRRNPLGEMVPGLGDSKVADLPMYRDRDVAIAVAAGEVVFVTESESSVDAFIRAGFYATTWPGSASTMNFQTVVTALTNALVMVVPDNDDPGLRAAERLVAALLPVAADLGVELPEPGLDARDLLEDPVARKRLHLGITPTSRSALRRFIDDDEPLTRSFANGESSHVAPSYIGGAA